MRKTSVCKGRPSESVKYITRFLTTIWFTFPIFLALRELKNYVMHRLRSRKHFFCTPKFFFLSVHLAFRFLFFHSREARDRASMWLLRSSMSRSSNMTKYIAQTFLFFSLFYLIETLYPELQNC